MRFATMLALAGAAVANTVTFWTLDTTARVIIFTPNAGQAAIPSCTVDHTKNVTVSFPEGWVGNWYGYPANAPNPGPGMLGEVQFNGWNNLVYFDVSAIVNAADVTNVQTLWPVGAPEPVAPYSGCPLSGFPCNSAYYHPDDQQTRTTTITDFFCTLGKGPTITVQFAATQ